MLRFVPSWYWLMFSQGWSCFVMRDASDSRMTEKLSTGKNASEAAIAARALLLIGLDRIAGCFSSDAIAEWKRSGRPVGCVAQTDSAALAPRIANQEVVVVDVRDDSEWALGRLPGALHIPLGHLDSRVAEIPRTAPIVVHCQGGSRSAIAASVLLRHGMEVSDLRGGIGEWSRAGHGVAHD